MDAEKQKVCQSWKTFGCERDLAEKQRLTISAE
jgi:hypothetical protein